MGPLIDTRLEERVQACISEQMARSNYGYTYDPKLGWRSSREEFKEPDQTGDLARDHGAIDPWREAFQKFLTPEFDASSKFCQKPPQKAQKAAVVVSFSGSYRLEFSNASQCTLLTGTGVRVDHSGRLTFQLSGRSMTGQTDADGRFEASTALDGDRFRRGRSPCSETRS